MANNKVAPFFPDTVYTSLQVFVGVSIASVASSRDGLLLDLLIFRYIAEILGRLVINDAINRRQYLTITKF